MKKSWVFFLWISILTAFGVEEDNPMSKNSAHVNQGIGIVEKAEKVHIDQSISFVQPRTYIIKLPAEEDSELDNVSTVISESDIKVLEKISEEEQEKHLIDALRRKKKSNKVYQGESYDFGTTSTSSGVVISSGISFKKK